MNSYVVCTKINPSVPFLLVFGLLLAGGLSPVYAQDEWQDPAVSWLQEVMPEADSFSGKQSDPPVFLAYRSVSDRDDSELVGYVFTTPDLPPEEAGFSGPVDMLIGMDLQGRITGVKVLYYLESYKYFRGDFIADSEFPNQFLGKSIEDEFRVGRDVDGISRATITSWAMARGLRNAARRIAEATLTNSSYVAEATAEYSALQSLQEQTWQELINTAFVKEFSAPIENEADLQFAVAYMGHYRLGELLVGAADYSNADRTASGLVEEGHMLLIGLDGNTARLKQLRLGALQNDVLYPNRKDRVVFAGTAKEGKIAGQAQFAVIMFLDAAIDITQPFTVIYDTGERSGEFEEYVGVDYQLPPAVLTLINGMPFRAQSNGVDGELIGSDQGTVQGPNSAVTWSDFVPVIIVLVLVLLVLNRKRIIG